MKPSASGKSKYITLFISAVVLNLIFAFSFITVKRIVVSGEGEYQIKEFSLKKSKEAHTSLASPKLSPPYAKKASTYPYTVENPPAGVKAIKDRFLASDNFPADEKTSLEDILLAVGDAACGYNKIKGLQCGGATSVFRDIKGVCWGVTPIPYDPCCGAPPQYVNDPRDKDPRCPEPTCSGFCYCAPPPAGCEPIIPQSVCLPLACNCVCAARAGGGQFAWLWDSVTGFCGCNP